jgi:energy-coupling factor transporter transmembrane protein EcfT
VLETPPVLLAGPLTSPPGIIYFLILILVVVIIARVVLKIAWKLALIAVGVLILLWLLGIVTL